MIIYTIQFGLDAIKHMSVKISYKKLTGKPSTNTVLFVDEKFNTNNLKSYISSADLTFIKELLKNCDLKKNFSF